MAEPTMQFKSSVMGVGRDGYDPETIDNAQYVSTKFYFQQRRGRLDLRTLSQIDLDRIVRDVDIDVLQMHLENITFCNLKEEDLRFLTDPQVIKLFRTSQLMIEYLLYAQEQLASNLQQMANRYGSKKRSLAKKRIELAELQESTKHLRQEVKTKKNSVAALEHLLKTANRPHSKRTSRRDADDEKPVAQPIRQSVIQFFVSGPDGLCVEFNERVTCSIHQLGREVRKAFVTKQNKRSKGKGNDDEVRLIYHGRILLDEGTIESNNIRSGDTIVAIIDNEDSDGSFSDAQQKVSAPIPLNQSVTPDVVDLLARQQDTMKNVAQEMRLGWESALQALSKSQKQQQSEPKSQLNEQELLGKMDVRWMKLEQSMRDQLNSQLGEYKELLAAGTKNSSVVATQPFRSGLQVGDLESDTEDLLVTRDEFAGRLRDSSDRIGRMDGEIESLKSTLERQNMEMRLLRQQVNDNKGVHNTYNDYGKTVHEASPTVAPVQATVYVPVPVPIVVPAPVVAPPPVKVAAVIAPPAPVPIPVPEKKVLFAQPEDVFTPRPVPVAAAAIPPPVKVLPIEIPAVKEVVPVVKEALDDGCIDIIFPSAFNMDLISSASASGPGASQTLDPVTGKPAEAACVRVLKDITPDDLVFELRHYLATEVVTTGLDIENETPPLTAVRAASLAASGALSARISRGKPLNDAQLDVLVTHWEGQQLLGLAEVPTSLRPQGGSKSPPNKSLSGMGVKGIASRDKKKRSWDDNPNPSMALKKEGKDLPPNPEDPWGTNSEMTLRRSLSAALNDLSDRDGLTDDELQTKVRALRRSTEQLPDGLSTHLMEFRGSVAGAMAAAAADSGSEDLYTESDRIGRPRSSTVTLSLSDTAQTKRQQLRDSQDFSKDSGDRSRSRSQSQSELLRLSLPNGGWGRRSIESFDDDGDGDGDFSYGHQSGSFRVVDDDSAPMMASLNLPKKQSTVAMNTSLTSAVDMRASRSLSPDPSESSLTENMTKSKYASFMESVNASKTAKKIPFGSDDSMEEIQSPGAKGIAVAAQKSSFNVPRSEGKDGTSSAMAGDYKDIRGFDDSDEEEGLDSLRFDSLRGGGMASNGDTGTLSGLGMNAGLRGRDSTDLGSTVSTLGASLKKEYSYYPDVRAEAKGGLGRFDFDRTVDSEGDMLRGREVPHSQVMQRADAYERRFASSDAHLKSPQPSINRRPGAGIGASPMSRGSSFNSGLFDNLAATDEVQEFGTYSDRDKDNDGTNSLALSDSGTRYSDSAYVLSTSMDS